MADYKSYSLFIPLVEELTNMGDLAKMNFSSTADAIHWALREGVEKLRQSVVTRKAIHRDDAPLTEEAVPAEA